MFNFIIGCVIGFVVATFGLGNVLSIIDSNLDKAKETIESHNELHK